MASPTMDDSSFDLLLSYQGRSVTLPGITTTATVAALAPQILAALDLNADEVSLKILLKGKRLNLDDNVSPLFAVAPAGKKPPKLLVMATPRETVQEIQTLKSDPTIRGFDNEKQPSAAAKVPKHWGRWSEPHAQYKFGKLEVCTWHSFGHRTSDQTPHAFEAMRLLEKLSTDPGIVAILQERELYVNTLGEMDPIDDRLMQKHKQNQPNSCLLGYNTNHGLRIDIKLRQEKLDDGFRPYPQLVQTLIHELSHNWVGEHNLLFWTNLGQMRAEYLHVHAQLRSSSTYLVQGGQTTAELAGLTPEQCQNPLATIRRELQSDMAQHGLTPDMILVALQQRCRELEESGSPVLKGILDRAMGASGHRLGGGERTSGSADRSSGPKTARELALEAAERRAQEQQQEQQQQDPSSPAPAPKDPHQNFSNGN